MKVPPIVFTIQCCNSLTSYHANKEYMMKNKRENQKRPRELEDEQEHSGDELNVKIATWGPNQATLDSAVHEAMEHSSIQGLLKGTRHRLLSIELVETEAKVKTSQPS